MRAGSVSPHPQENEEMEPIEITVTFTAAQAWQLAQFLKRVS